jgi:hypothetical protein
MSQINDGGPAFPVPDTYHPNGQVQFGSSGMSLRDYFAAHASDEDIERHHRIIMQRTACRPTTEQCKYAYADAMIQAGSEHSNRLGQEISPSE